MFQLSVVAIELLIAPGLVMDFFRFYASEALYVNIHLVFFVESL
jgi:hypothetical protein